MKNKKGFTLIELLAIIAILGFILVITIPIILNTIEKSKEGAAVASARGFIDAIDKYKMNKSTELDDESDFSLEGSYSVQNGILVGPNISGGVEIPISGTIPSSGSLSYFDDDLNMGCLVVNEYEVTFEEKKVVGVKKGNCGITEPEIVIVDEFQKVEDENPGVICGTNVIEDYDNSDICYIYSVEDLVQFSNLVNSGKDFQNKTVKLMNNLDIKNDKSYKNPKGNDFGDVNEDGTTEATLKAELIKEEAKGFKPIGNDSKVFKGTFDGNIKKIKNLYINRSSEDYIGLFGYNQGTIKGLKIESSNITGNENVGLLAGYSYYGNITSTIIDGNVTGNRSIGLAVGNIYAGTLETAASGNVTGTTNYTGGIIGYAYYGTIGVLYRSGSITSSEGTRGRLIGYNYNGYASIRGIVSNSVATSWEVSSPSLTYNEGYSIPSSDVDQIGVYEAVLDTYIGKDNNSDGYYYDMDSSGNMVVYSIVEKPFTITMSGDGSSESPYVVSSSSQIREVGYDPTKNYVLNSDVSMTNETPILFGSEVNNFTGTFNGNNHTISNIKSIGTVNSGLFGNNTGIVKNLNISNSTIRVYDNAGLVTGTNKGTVDNVNINNVTLTGNSNIGLISGENDGTIKGLKITSSSVTGNENVGLLAGYSYYGNITSTIIDGNVTGNRSIGLAVGNIYAGTLETVASGNVTGTTDDTGGIIGYAYYGTIRVVYRSGSITSLAGARGRIIGYNYNGYADIKGNVSNAVITNWVVSSPSLTYNEGATVTPAELLTAAPYEEVDLNMSETNPAVKEYRYVFDSNNNLYIIKNS